jgi:calcium/proton exchanger cax
MIRVELILSLAALSKGLYDVVAMSLVGSVLSNLLLVLGACGLRVISARSSHHLLACHS